jgi:antitoxin component YwqK of YwqJK toxin-antitoxin module
LYFDYYTHNLIRKESFVNGVRQGITETYLNNKICKHIPYSNGLIEGDLIYFDLAGNKISSVSYKDDLPQKGIEVQIFESFDNLKKTIYENGKIIELQYISNNNLLEKQVLVKGEEFFTTIYYSGGKPKFTYSLSNNLLQGKVTYFSESGKKVYVGWVENGTMIGGELWLNTTNYFNEEKSDFYKLTYNKARINLKGIALPKKVEFELSESLLSQERKSMIFNFLSITSLSPSMLYNNTESTGIFNSGLDSNFNPPAIIEQIKN